MMNQGHTFNPSCDRIPGLKKALEQEWKMDDPENDAWIQQEFASLDLGDERRNRRLRQIVTALSGQPSASLPVAFDKPAALKAAYRFFDNPANEAESILASHLQATYERIKTAPLVLAVQDTTYLDFSHFASTEGLGPLVNDYQQGLVVHSTLAITPERIPLGVLQQQVWARDAETFAQLPDHKQRPIEEKESYKWLLSLESVIAAHQFVPQTRLVSVADREGDIFDLFIQDRPEGVDLLVRATQDRGVVDEEARTIWSALRATPVAARLELRLPKTAKSPARTAQVEVHWKELQLCPPPRLRKEHPEPVQMWAVWVIEPEPPEGETAVEWLLLTTVSVNKLANALERVAWYACRWGIEVWHKVLKSGCKIEKRQLQDAENLKRLLSVFSVVAWKILYGTMLARAMPDVPCTTFFQPEEWQAAYCVIHKVAVPPEETPTLREAIRMVAQLGGFVGRKGDGEPGVTVLWRGFQRLHDLTLMYKILRPGGNPQDTYG